MNIEAEVHIGLVHRGTDSRNRNVGFVISCSDGRRAMTELRLLHERQSKSVGRYCPCSVLYVSKLTVANSGG